MQAMTVAVHIKAKETITPAVTKATASLQQLESHIAKVRNTSAKVGAAGAAALTALSASVGSVVSKYQDLAKAKGEVKSLGLSANDLKPITQEAKAFSNAFAGTSQADFVRAAYDIKSGISSLSATGVAKYTQLAALTGKATKSTTEQMTSFFATGYNIYSKQFDKMAAKTVKGWENLSKEEKDIKFGEYFAAGIAGAVKEFKTNGQKMQSAIETLGSTATTSNVPLAEQLSILGTLQATMSGSEAATRYKAFLIAATKAQEKLKLQFLDSNNQLKSTPEILEILRQKYGDVLDDIEKKQLKDAFGTDEAVQYITALYDKTQDLLASQQRLNRTMQNGTKDVLTMAKAMNEGREFELLKQRAENLMTTIGAKFAPMAVAIAGYIGDITERLDRWMSANDGTVDTLVAVTTAVGGTLAAVTALGLGISALSLAFSHLIKITRLSLGLLGKFGTKTRVSAKAIKALGETMESVAAKPLSVRLGMQPPKKQTIIGRFKHILSALAQVARANPILIAATVTVGALGYMASAQHQELMDNRPASSSESVNSLKERIARYEARLAAMKGEGDFAGRAKEWFLHGNATQAEIKQQEKLLEHARRQLANKMPVQAVASKTSATTHTFSAQELQAAREEAYRQKALLDRKRELAKVAAKKTENNIHIEAPIHITVNAVEGKVPTQTIAHTVQNAIKKATDTKQVTSYEDKE